MDDTLIHCELLLFKIGVVTNTRAVWETARGICSALSEHRSPCDRASGRERVKHVHPNLG